MNKCELIKKFEKIKELTNGNNTNNSEIIDYLNGFSISISEIKEEYYKYIELQQKIDDYIYSKDLDDVINEKEIKEHFKNFVSSEYFNLNQATLIDFEYYITKLIKNKI